MPEENPIVMLAVVAAVVFPVVAGILGWLLLRRGEMLDALRVQYVTLEAEAQRLQNAEALQRRDLEHLTQAQEQQRVRAEHLNEALVAERSRSGELERDYAVLQTRFDEAQRQHREQIQLLEEAKAALAQQFENLANRIFEQKAKTFDAANQQQMLHLLKPFREQIDAFSKQSRERYDAESKDRHLLKDEITRLKQLNERISEDALNLTNALKGENKTQGNWGEIVLERVLESSGLRNGHEYETQGTYKDEEGNQLRPDVVVFLPQQRCVIIDSKVSLTAYEAFVSRDDPDAKAQALRQHLASVNAHVKGLSDKRYENLPGMRTLDFVLLFMPIEGAFHLALQHDSGLFKKAYDARIIMVGPSTLLATLRTIENIWRTERQQQNAEKIAKQAEDLYDKFVGFIEDMERIGEQIGKSRDSWEKAMGKLGTGRGNLIRRVEQMRELGLSPKKTLPRLEDEG